MKKRALYSGLSVLALGAMAIMPTHAATTDVTVGVTDTPPAVISVNVPASVPMAVVVDKTQAAAAPTLLVGSTTKTIGGLNGVDPTNPASAVADLKFENAGTTDVQVTKATVDNVKGSIWTLASAAVANTATTNVHELNLGFDTLNTLATDITPGTSKDITGAAIDITKGAAKYVKMTGKVGGTNADYTNEADALAFHVTWTIAAK